jgi:hypothetical protein
MLTLGCGPRRCPRAAQSAQCRSGLSAGEVLIRRSKTDQTGGEIVIPRGLRIRPVEAVQAWLQAAGIGEGLLFRAIQRGGRVKLRNRATLLTLMARPPPSVVT